MTTPTTRLDPFHLRALDLELGALEARGHWWLESIGQAVDRDHAELAALHALADLKHRARQIVDQLDATAPEPGRDAVVQRAHHINQGLLYDAWSLAAEIEARTGHWPCQDRPAA